ncbi:MAG: hypothetical protein ACK41F_07455 [Fimbriimonadaceae bacterium]
MRKLVHVGLASLCLAASAGAARDWSINPFGTPIWEGKPYLPFGFQCSPSQIGEAPRSADLLVSAAPDPKGWDWLESLERRDGTYLIELSSAGPSVFGCTVEPQSFRVDAPKGSVALDCRLPGAKRVLAVLADKRDGAILWHQVIDADPDGAASVAADARGAPDSVLLLYPIGETRATPDFWEGFDAHRDALLATLRRSPLGPRCRGLVNPLGRNPSYPSDQTSFVPFSPLFRMELERHLREAYRNFTTAQRAWGLGASELQDFQDLARLVPLWSGKRGVQVLWDPDRGKFWPCATGQSRAWANIRAVMRQAALRRAASLIATIKDLAAVPVLQEHIEGSDLFAGNLPGLDGLCLQASGATVGQFARSVAAGVSVGLRWRTKAWVVVGRLVVQPSDGWDVRSLIQELEAMGVRGAFVPWSSQAQSLASQPLEFSPVAASVSPRVLPFPVAAFEPAQVQGLPGGWVWLPGPGTGRRLDLGESYRGYTYDDGTPLTVLWRAAGSERVRLRHSSAKDLSFETLDGSDPRPRLVKGGVEVTLGELPLLVRGSAEPPIPEPAIDETLAAFERLLKLGEQLKRVAPSEAFAFRQAVASLDRSPAFAYEEMRLRFWRLNLLMASFSWVEAEGAKSLAVGEVAPSPGASAGSVVRLVVPTVLAKDPIVATLALPVRSEVDQELWIAARLPGDQSRFVTLVLRGQRMQLQPTPVAPYGDGFAWYRAGLTKLETGMAELRIEVEPADGLDLAFDAVLLAPAGVRPKGPWMPLTPTPSR